MHAMKTSIKYFRALAVGGLLTFYALGGCEKPAPEPDPVDPVSPVDSVDTLVSSFLLSGRVSNVPHGGFPLAGVSVLSGLDTLGFGVTGVDGFYSVRFSEVDGSYRVVVESLGHDSFVGDFDFVGDSVLDVVLGVVPGLEDIVVDVNVSSVQTGLPVGDALVSVRGGGVDLVGGVSSGGVFSGVFSSEFWAFGGDTVRVLDDLVVGVVADNFYDWEGRVGFGKGVGLEARLLQRAEFPGGVGRRLRLYEVAEGVVSPGFVIFGGDTVLLRSGEAELYIPSGLGVLETRLANPFDFRVWGFVRRTDLSEFGVGDVETFNVDYYLRDFDGLVVDSLFVHGFSDEGVHVNKRNMSPGRFREFMRLHHFDVKTDVVGYDDRFIGNFSVGDMLRRWSGSSDGFLPRGINVYTNIERLYLEDSGEVVRKGSVMSAEMRDAIVRVNDDWLRPIFGVIPVTFYDDLVFTSAPPFIYTWPENQYTINITVDAYIPPDKVAFVGVTLRPDGEVRDSWIKLPPMLPYFNDAMSTIAHELARPLSGGGGTIWPYDPFFRHDESALVTGLQGWPPISRYDIKMWREVVYFPLTSRNKSLVGRPGTFKLGEPLDNILGLMPHEVVIDRVDWDSWFIEEYK
jgi:hypothetical protein